MKATKAVGRNSSAKQSNAPDISQNSVGFHSITRVGVIVFLIDELKDYRMAKD
jgi:hypothetical protein